jgi:hypothetical protein
MGNQEISEKIEKVSSLNDLVPLDNLDFGVTFQDQEQYIPLSKVREHFRALESLILPLLENLKKTPEKPIHWPNRRAQIEKQIQSILEVTRLYE